MALYGKYLQIFIQNCGKLAEFQRFLNVICRNRFSKNTSTRALTAGFHTSHGVLKKRRSSAERKEGVVRRLISKPRSELVDVWPNMTVSELASVLNKDIPYVYNIFLGNVRHPHEVINDIKQLKAAVERTGKRMKIIGRPKQISNKETDQDVYPRPPASREDLRPRPPIVTVMGHVDHGKTTLLDALRNSNVAEKEFGGITQHIGPFFVTLPNGRGVTFIDTPGHAAFKAMRARGANITDIVVLVVAANDGVKEQTVESIRMAKEAGVPIIVAINKIDTLNANIEKTEKMLLIEGIQVESMGGDVQAIPISALHRMNLDKLMEAIQFEAELKGISADPTGLVEAVVIDSRVHPYRGRLCSVIVQRGTLRKGSVLVADTCYAKVRTLRDANGNCVKEILPGYPAEVEGWKNLPPAGERILQVKSEKRAKMVIKVREEKKEQEKTEETLKAIKAKEDQHLAEYKQKLEYRRKMGRFKLKPEGPRKPEIEPEDDKPHIRLIVKADVDGTVEAIMDTINTYELEEVKLSLVHFDVGDVTENDVKLAGALNGSIYAFNVECSEQIQKMAERNNVPIKHHNVIYKLIDDLKDEISSKMPPKEVEEVIGEATVLQQFFISEKRKKVPVAGCKCIKGLLKKSSKFKVIRNGKVIHKGLLASMRHIKEEADVINTNMNCGLQFLNKDIMFEPGDLIICYETKLEGQRTDWNPGF